LTALMIKAINANCIPKKPLPPLIINITPNIKPNTILKKTVL